MNDTELEPINVSALNQYSYCARRCGLIYLEGEFADNVHTQRGHAEHERVDRIAHATTCEGARVEYALPIWHERLGLIGKCDVVEFWPDGRLYPVEYKHGRRRAWLNDDIQLAAQALCLEEMFGTRIDRGAIFHASSRRRREVEIAAALREDVARTLAALRTLLADARLPAPTTDVRRCAQCSLRQTCQPEAARAMHNGSAELLALFRPDGL